MTKRLLVVIDYQNDLISPDGAVAKKLGVDKITRGAALAPKLQTLVDHWSIQMKPILFIKSDYNLDNYSGAYLKNRQSSAFGDIANTGTWGHKLYNLKIDDVQSDFITKHYFDGYYQTNLEAYLENLKPDEIYFCGVNTDVCVFHTVMNTIIRGYKTFLIEDATEAISKNKALFISYMTGIGVKLVKSENLLNQIKNPHECEDF